MKNISGFKNFCYNNTGESIMTLPNNKKMSNLCILEILKEHSDENHPLTQADIINKIYNQFGMELERKSISANIDSLIDFGFDIVKTTNGCYLGQREFEQSEIAFLVDAVFSSKSINSKHSKELAEKISSFSSKYNRKKFNYIYKTDEIIRTDNKQLFYTIEILNQAIEEGKKVEFNYHRFYMDKETNEKKKQKRYVINPYFMINNQGRYYLVCNYDYFDEIANYKLELINDIKILDEPVKPITKLKNCEKGVDIAKYANENIYMFHNKAIDATLKIEDDYSAEYVVEWFGKKTRFYEKNGEKFADIISNEDALLYWCLQYGENIELVSPAETREKLQEKIKKIYKKYN